MKDSDKNTKAINKKGARVAKWFRLRFASLGPGIESFPGWFPGCLMRRVFLFSARCQWFFSGSSGFLPLLKTATIRGSDLPMLQAGFFGGDMKGFDPNDKNAITDPNKLWPNRIIPFYIDPSLSQVEGLIYQAMAHYRQYTCLQFVERTYETDYIYITLENGCYSMVGRQGGPQIVSLGNGCHYMGTVLHELMHAAGFWHEQNRPDRDDYIIIYWENIQQGMESNFVKMGYDQVQLLGEPYDIQSVMQYGEYAFSKDNQSPTMKAISGEQIPETWEKNSFSASDQRRIQKLYNC